MQHLKFQILKHHPGSRCTFEIAMETANGWGWVVGKVYAVDRPDVYRTMQEIQRAGFGLQEELSIPQPLAYLPGLRLLLQEKVPGQRAKQVFLIGSERDGTKASVRCARWLAKFHALGPRSGDVSEPIGQLHSIARWSRSIAKLGQPLAAMAERLSRRLEEEVAEARGTARCAGHGSFNCNQIILTEDRTIAFDWDSYDLADPCRDVARFLVALQRLAFKYLGSIRALDGIAEVFLKTYQALSPFEVAENLPWYRALACLRLSFYEADRPVCILRDGIEALLSEGMRALEG
jgi:aminoglycoside phosphotransferase (APT) family kinase protein